MSVMKTLCTLLVAALAAIAQGGMNPCHKSKKEETADCETVYFPTTLCEKCILNTVNVMEDGNLEKCDAFYDVETEACLAAFESYVEANPCDERRAQALMDARSTDPAKKKAGIVSLDYFAYATCEECCDCIPQGASVDEAESVGKGAIKVDRGNCPAHYYYDICAILPKMANFGIAIIDGSRPAFEASTPPIIPAEDTSTPPITPAEESLPYESTMAPAPGPEMMLTTGRRLAQEGYGYEYEVGLADNTVIGTQLIYKSPDGKSLCGEGSIYEEWFQTEKNGWATATEIGMSDEVRLSLDELMAVLNCESLDAWEACHFMEYRQGRV